MRMSFHMGRSALAVAMLVAAAACGFVAGKTDGGEGGVSEASGAGTPPPLPADAKSEAFTRESGAPAYWGVAPGEAVPLIWDDLMPEGAAAALEEQYAEFYAALEARYGAAGSLEAIEEGSSLDEMPQFGSFETVPELDGLKVRIPGYPVPFDFNPDARHKTFLFVPYMGACIHTPPPPPNQIIFVEANPAVKIPDIWQAYWIEGKLSAAKRESDMGDAAYALALEKIESYLPQTD